MQKIEEQSVSLLSDTYLTIILWITKQKILYKWGHVQISNSIKHLSQDLDWNVMDKGN